MPEVDSTLLARARETLGMREARSEKVIEDAVARYIKAGVPDVDLRASPRGQSAAVSLRRVDGIRRVQNRLREPAGRSEVANRALAYVVRKDQGKLTGFLPFFDPLGVVSYDSRLPFVDPLLAAASDMFREKSQ